MKTEFFLTVSGAPQLELQAELFVRSLDWFGGLDYSLTVCQGPADRLESSLLKLKAKVVINQNLTGLEPAWYGSLGCVPESGDVTVYADADLLVTGDLRPAIDRCRKSGSVCGVVAYADPFRKHGSWGELFSGCGLRTPERKFRHLRGGDCPFYPNLGFVVVPTEFVPLLNRELPRFLKLADKVYPGHYHRPQFAMCLAIHALGLPHQELPLRWNQPDLYDDLPAGNPAVVHLLKAKSLFHDRVSLREFLGRKPYNKMGEVVQGKLRFVSRGIL